MDASDRYWSINLDWLSRLPLACKVERFSSRANIPVQRTIEFPGHPGGGQA